MDRIPNIQSSALLRIGTGTRVRPDTELFRPLLNNELGLELDRTPKGFAQV